MSASASDKFRKVSRKWVGQIGAAGVSDDTTTTIPLASSTNLPTDTGVTIVIDRVDSSGTATPSLEETVTGVVSGSDLVSCTRGVEGTAQAHLAGAVVEVLLTAAGYNDIIAGIVAEHSQAGAHTASSTSAAGVVELATSAETTTGTDATRAVSPDGLAGSDYGKRVAVIQVVAPGTDTATGDGKAFFVVPSILNGYNLVGVSAAVYTAGTTNTTDVQIRNVTDSVDMLSTKITIDSTETTTGTAATPAVIDGTHDDVATNDVIAIDIDAVSTTAAKGLVVDLAFQLP